LAVLEIGVRQEEQIMNGPGSKGLVKPPWQVLKANIVVIQPEASGINRLKHDYAPVIRSAWLSFGDADHEAFRRVLQADAT
jgi:hypothetical protein